MIEPFTLRVFRAVAEMLNYRRAADELHLTQPFVTAQTRSVQESLGFLGV
jgi:DNA-binding transcriptional LysR family regulator